VDQALIPISTIQKFPALVIFIVGFCIKSACTYFVLETVETISELNTSQA